MDTFIHTVLIQERPRHSPSSREEDYAGQHWAGELLLSSLSFLCRCSLRSAPSAAMGLGSGEAGVPLYSPISDSLYPLLAVLLLLIGLVLTASFFIYEVTSTKLSRSLVREFATGGGASLFLGFGTLYLLLWTGVYV